MAIALRSVIEFACLQLRKAFEACLKCSRKTQNLGLKKLLHSIVVQETDNEMLLSAIKNEAQTASIESTVNLDLAEFELQIDCTKAANEKYLLLLLLEQKKILEKLFRALIPLCKDYELHYLFGKLADDEMKQRIWVQDRYDLEALQ